MRLAPERTNADLKTPFAENNPPEKPPRVIAECPRAEDRASNDYICNVKLSDSLPNKSLCKTKSPKIMYTTIDKQ